MIRRRGQNTPRALAVLVGVAVLGMVGLAGCGGSSKLSNADFIKKADALCKSANDQIDKIAKPTSDTPTPDEIKRLLQDSFNVIDPTVKKLDDLKGEDAIEATLNDNLIAPTKAQSATAREALNDLKAAGSDSSKQEAAMKKLDGLDDPQSEQHDKALSDAGFKDCSQTNS